MNNTLNLLKIFLKNNFLFFKLRKSGKTKREQLSTFLFVLVLFILTGFLMFAYLSAIKGAFSLLTNFNQSPDAILSLVMIISQFLILIFGTIGVISVFYLSNDTERLIPLPIKPAEIVFARFVSILINQYIVLIPFILSAFIYYGILSKASLLYWLKLPIIYLLLPVIPLALITIIVMVLMRLVNFGKNKDKLIIIGSIVLMSLAVLPQIIGTKTIKDSGKDVEKTAVVKFLSSSDGLVHIIGEKFPPVIWATKGFTRGTTKEGITGFSMYLGTSILLFILLLYLGKLIFYKGLVGIDETQTGNKEKIDFSETSFSGSSSGIITIFKREFKEMNRTPMFFLNGVIAALFMPAIMLLWISLNDDEGKYKGLFSLFAENNSVLLVFIIAAMLFFSSGINGTPGSSFSREGKNFWYSKVLPISYSKQLAGKYLHALMIATIGYIGGFLIVFFSLKINLLLILKGSLLTIILTSISIAASLLIDLRKPILDWENHRKAMKQNPNVFISIFGIMGFVALLGFIVYKLMSSKIIDLQSLYIILIVFLSLLSIAIHIFLFKKADKLYQRLEI